jgi:hypothetical protein
MGDRYEEAMPEMAMTWVEMAGDWGWGFSIRGLERHGVLWKRSFRKLQKPLESFRGPF